MAQGGHDERQEGAAGGADEAHDLAEARNDLHGDSREADEARPDDIAGRAPRVASAGELLLEEAGDGEHHDGVGEEQADAEAALHQDGEVEAPVGGEVEGDMVILK